MGKFINARTLWVADKERVRDDIYRAISKNINGLNNYKEGSIIKDAIDSELDKFSMFEDINGGEDSLFWRLILLAWIPLQIVVLVPFCSVKWLCGKGWYLDSQSLLGRFHRRVFKNF